MKCPFSRSLRFSFLLSILFWLSACQTSLKEVDLNQQATVIEMSKGPCYGRCPVFTLSIYENGVATYQGERYTDKLGLHIKKLGKEEFTALLAQFRKANLWQFDNVYRGQIPDLQTVTITYYEEGDFKTITGKDGRPAILQTLEAELDDIAASEGWEAKDKPGADLPANAIADELIVQLNSGVDIYRWARKFRENDLKIIEEVSPGRNYWLVSYDAESIEPTRMLARVRADYDVVGVEFNKTGSERN